MGIFQDHEGNISSFRVVWVIAVLLIVFTWALASLKGNSLQPWPLDGMTTTALFFGPSAKTFTERTK